MAKTAKEISGTSNVSFDFSEPDINGFQIPKIQIRSYRVSSNLMTASRNEDLGSKIGDALKDSLKGNYEKGKALAGRSREQSCSVTLPIPDNLKFSSEFEWSVEGKSFLATVLGSLNADQSTKSEVGSAGANVASVLGRTLSNLDALGGELMLKNMGMYSDAMKELYFKGHSHRRFNWSWELVPRNAKEAEQMMKCIRKLKIDAHPEKFSRGLNVLPCEFEVTFMNAKLPTVGKLVCTLADGDYGDAGSMPRFTKDQYPAAMKLSLNLMELELLDRELLEGSDY